MVRIKASKNTYPLGIFRACYIINIINIHPTSIPEIPHLNDADPFETLPEGGAAPSPEDINRLGAARMATTAERENLVDNIVIDGIGGG